MSRSPVPRALWWLPLLLCPCLSDRASSLARVALSTDGALEPLEGEQAFQSLLEQASTQEALRKVAALDAELQLQQQGQVAQKVASGSQFLPLLMGIGLGRDVMKLFAACVCCMVLVKLLGKLPCSCNCRRCKPCAQGLLYVGWDEFESFDVLLTVHTVSDIAKDGLMGGKEFKVKISFGNSRWETFATKDCKWEQTKGMEVPQGASECLIQLYSVGKIRDSKLAEYSMDTKKDLLDRDEDFWGKKQKMKLEERGNIVGVLTMTFRLKEAGSGDGSGGFLPVAGVDEDSALAVALMEASAEMEAVPGFVRPEGKWEGDLKVELFSRVLCGELREVNEKNGKEKGKTYVRVLRCNVAELKGDQMEEQLQRQQAKARKKGLAAPPAKWYWAWYESRKAAHDRERWHYPDGFIPMISVMRVSRSPNRNDQFIVAYYAEDGKKMSLIYRRESGRGLEVWVEGLDLCYTECRKQVKDQKAREESTEGALVRMRQMHQQWLQRHGPPRSDEQWTRWFEWFKSNNYDEELIKKLFTELSAASQAPQQQKQGKSKEGRRK